MGYFAGLGIPMDETHVWVLDREGKVVHESKTASTAQAIADELAKAPSCRRIVFETGSNGPDLVPRAEPTRSARGLRGEPTGLSGAQVGGDPQDDRNDARGLAHLARTGFFKPVHVKSLPAPTPSAFVDQRAQEADRPARDLRKSDPWSRRSCSGSDCPARSPPPSSTTLLEQARGSLVSLPPCVV